MKMASYKMTSIIVQVMMMLLMLNLGHLTETHTVLTGVLLYRDGGDTYCVDEYMRTALSLPENVTSPQATDRGCGFFTVTSVNGGFTLRTGMGFFRIEEESPVKRITFSQDSSTHVTMEGLASNATEWGETGRAIYQYEESTVCLNVRTWCHRTIIESSCQSKWHLLPNEEEPEMTVPDLSDLASDCVTTGYLLFFIHDQETSPMYWCYTDHSMKITEQFQLPINISSLATLGCTLFQVFASKSVAGAYYFKSLSFEGFLYYDNNVGYEAYSKSPNQLFTFSGKQRSMAELLDTTTHKVLLPWELRGEGTVAFASCNLLKVNAPRPSSGCYKFILVEDTSSSDHTDTTCPDDLSNNDNLLVPTYDDECHFEEPAYLVTYLRGTYRCIDNDGVSLQDLGNTLSVEDASMANCSIFSLFQAQHKGEYYIKKIDGTPLYLGRNQSEVRYTIDPRMAFTFSGSTRDYSELNITDVPRLLHSYSTSDDMYYLHATIYPSKKVVMSAHDENTCQVSWYILPSGMEPGCQNDSCHNNGECCTLQTGDWKCLCPRHFTGPTCDTCIPHFTGDNCGVCEERWVGVNCDACIHGYSGENCSVENQCETGRFTCHNGGTCMKTATDEYSCSCAEGYTGTYCSDNVCKPNPCESGSECSISSMWPGFECYSDTTDSGSIRNISNVGHLMITSLVTFLSVLTCGI